MPAGGEIVLNAPGSSVAQGSSGVGALITFTGTEVHNGDSVGVLPTLPPGVTIEGDELLTVVTGNDVSTDVTFNVGAGVAAGVYDIPYEWFDSTTGESGLNSTTLTVTDYVPVNLLVFTVAYAGCMSAMTFGGRVNPDSDPAAYAAAATAAWQWATTFDEVWSDAADLDTLQVFLIVHGSYGAWFGRAPQALSDDECRTLATAIIASITQSETQFASEGVTPPAWGSGGGGGGVPPTPPNSVGWVLTSTNSTGGSLPALSSSEWVPPGGPEIVSFSKNHGASFEVGATDVQPTFAATYNELPVGAEIIYTQQPGSPLVLTTPFTAGQILETFTSDVIATATFELQATFAGPVVKTDTLTDTWGLPIFSYVDAPGNIALTQGYLDTMRAAEGVQIHTSATGDYLVGATVGPGQISILGIPETIDVGTIFTDLNDDLPVSPSLVGTVAYTNPHGVTFNVNLYTVGAIDIGVTAGWGLS